MQGINQQIALNTNTNIDLGPLGQITHLKVHNRTGAALYALVDAPNSAVPGAANAHFVVGNGLTEDFEFDNAADAPGSLRVRTGSTGYIHITGW